MSKKIAFLLFAVFAPVFVLNANGLDDYYQLKATNPTAARSALADYVAEKPSDVTAQLEMAYILTDEKKFNEAAEHLNTALKAEPENENVQRQLAYTYQQMGKGPLAHKNFTALNDCQALVDMASRRWQFLPRPYFADLYLAPTYLSRFDDFITYGQARAGVALDNHGEWELYGSLRYTDDSKSTGGRIPAIWADNAAIYAAGVRYHPSTKIPISIYAEQGRAYDLLYQNRDRWRDDFRSGLSYYDEWTPRANCNSNWRFPFTRTASLYSDASYYSRYDYNWIGYLQWREGRRLIEKNRTALDGFLYLGGSMDSNKDYYNNVGEWGVGATLTPDQAYPFFFRYTVVRGSYLNVTTSAPNPDNSSYTDHRWQFVGQVRF